MKSQLVTSVSSIQKPQNKTIRHKVQQQEVYECVSHLLQFLESLKDPSADFL